MPNLVKCIGLCGLVLMTPSSALAGTSNMPQGIATNVLRAIAGEYFGARGWLKPRAIDAVTTNPPWASAGAHAEDAVAHRQAAAAHGRRVAAHGTTALLGAWLTYEAAVAVLTPVTHVLSNNSLPLWTGNIPLAAAAGGLVGALSFVPLKRSAIDLYRAARSGTAASAALVRAGVSAYRARRR